MIFNGFNYRHKGHKETPTGSTLQRLEQLVVDSLFIYIRKERDLKQLSHILVLLLYISCASDNSDNDGTTRDRRDTTAPKIPQNFTATLIISSRINLAWNPSAEDTDVYDYRIYRNGIF